MAVGSDALSLEKAVCRVRSLRRDLGVPPSHVPVGRYDQPAVRVLKKASPEVGIVDSLVAVVGERHIDRIAFGPVVSLVGGRSEIPLAGLITGRRGALLVIDHAKVAIVEPGDGAVGIDAAFEGLAVLLIAKRLAPAHAGILGYHARGSLHGGQQALIIQFHEGFTGSCGLKAGQALLFWFGEDPVSPLCSGDVQETAAPSVTTAGAMTREEQD